MAKFGVVIRCDAGGGYGLGHAARCLTLASALHEVGAEVVFVVQPGMPEGRDFIAARGGRVHVSPGFAGQAVDSAFVNELLRELSHPAVLVLDSRDLVATKLLAYSGAALTLCIDDENLRNLPCSILVNYHPWADRASYKPLNERILLLGLAYNLVEQAIFDAAGQRNPKRNVSRVLVTMGGEDPGNHTLRVIEVLAGLLAAFDVDIVIGPAHPDPSSVVQAAARHLPAAILHRAPRGLSELMVRADIAISAGGITCYELAAARVPTAAVPVEPHQVPLVESLEHAGTLLRLDRDGAIDETAINRLVSDAVLRDKMVDAASKLMPGSGAGRIATQVRDLLAERAVA